MRHLSSIGSIRSGELAAFAAVLLVSGCGHLNDSIYAYIRLCSTEDLLRFNNLEGRPG